MQKQKIIFYKSMDDLEKAKTANNGLLSRSMTVAEINKTIKAFNEGKIKELLCHRNFLTGWRTVLTAATCQVDFLGDDWTEQEQEQGQMRLSYPVPSISSREALKEAFTAFMFSQLPQIGEPIEVATGVRLYRAVHPLAGEIHFLIDAMGEITAVVPDTEIRVKIGNVDQFGGNSDAALT